MTKLSVNINKIATLRNTRMLEIPDIVHLSRIALEAGAQGLTIHPRPDERHIRAYDVNNLARLWKESGPGIEFNIEGNPFYRYMEHIRQVRPTQCTLVPDMPEAFTSNRGWILTGPKGGEGAANAARLRPMIAEMKSLGCRVSLFMNAGAFGDVEAARDIGADRVELYTEPYAADFAGAAAAPSNAALARALSESLEVYAQTTRHALKLGLQVNAGHDLNLHNLPPFLQRMPQIAEVSIGHALIADALEFGMAQTVRKYLAACAAT